MTITQTPRNDATHTPDIRDWTQKSFGEILADIDQAIATTQRRKPPEALVVLMRQYIALIRGAKDPYRRIKMLYNAGCRGRDLR